jgi:hypothetical protein
MNQPTHAWLAVQAYRKIADAAETAEGKSQHLDGLARLLAGQLQDVVVGAWLPDSLIKDMTYGHVFKNTTYTGDQAKRFTLSKDQLKAQLGGNAVLPSVAFDVVPDEWWTVPYRVKPSGGHLPARVNAMSQTARDMFKMGDPQVVELTGVAPKGAESIVADLRFTPRNIAEILWMVSHYVADGHMPLHCDARALASTAKQDTHCAIETVWGEQVPELFHAKTILHETPEAILAARPSSTSEFARIDFGVAIAPLKSGDPWHDAVMFCRAGLATSFAWVPPRIAAVGDVVTRVSLEDILKDDVCGRQRFWDISRAVMADSVNSIASLWLDAWLGFVRPDRPMVEDAQPTG